MMKTLATECRCALAVVATLVAASAATAETTRVRAGGYVTPDGTLASGVEVLIKDGVIRDVRRLEEPGEASEGIASYPNGILCPGLIDAHSALTAERGGRELVDAIEADVQAGSFFDPYHRNLADALKDGITCVVLAPGGDSLIGGRAAAVKTSDAGGETRWTAEGPAKMSLAPEIYRTDRMPTSPAGAMSLLRRTLDEAKNGDRDGLVGRLAAGKLPVIVDCPTAGEIDLLLGLADSYDIQWTFLHGADAVDVADRLRGTGHRVLLPPYSLSSPPRVLMGAAALAKAGVPFAFTAMMPHHDGAALRISAALAAQYGLDPAAARRALTLEPARLTGLEESLGSIEPGKSADLVVFSADPLRLDARVLAVYVAGVLEYSTDAERTID